LLAHEVLNARSMASSDRAFRALAQAEPDLIARLLRIVAPHVVPASALLLPENVDDPHVHGLPPPKDADMVARIGDGDVVHVEAQGYRDTSFDDRVVYYHLTFALRFRPRVVHTVAIWLLRAPESQRRDVIEVGDVTVRITNVLLSEVNASLLLADDPTACFAAGARAGQMSEGELCERVVEGLKRSGASWTARHMAVVAAATCGRYEMLMQAMKRADMEPIVIEDLVKFGEDRGFERGIAQGVERGIAQGVERGIAQGVERGIAQGSEQGALQNAKQALIDVLSARGLIANQTQLERIERESNLTRLRSWLRSAATAASVGEAITEAP
jgi:hypothetical protein